MSPPPVMLWMSAATTMETIPHWIGPRSPQHRHWIHGRDFLHLRGFEHLPPMRPLRLSARPHSMDHCLGSPRILLPRFVFSIHPGLSVLKLSALVAAKTNNRPLPHPIWQSVANLRAVDDRIARLLQPRSRSITSRIPVRVQRRQSMRWRYDTPLTWSRVP